MLRHLDAPAALGLEPAREGAGVGAIGPDQLQARKLARTGLADERLGAEPVVQIGGINMSEKDEAAGIDEDVPLLAQEQFARASVTEHKDLSYSSANDC